MRDCGKSNIEGKLWLVRVVLVPYFLSLLYRVSIQKPSEAAWCGTRSFLNKNITNYRGSYMERRLYFITLILIHDLTILDQFALFLSVTGLHVGW